MNIYDFIIRAALSIPVTAVVAARPAHAAAETAVDQAPAVRECGAGGCRS